MGKVNQTGIRSTPSVVPELERSFFKFKESSGLARPHVFLRYVQVASRGFRAALAQQQLDAKFRSRFQQRIEDYPLDLTPRLYMLEQLELAPKIFPVVLQGCGLEPNSQPRDWAPAAETNSWLFLPTAYYQIFTTPSFSILRSRNWETARWFRAAHTTFCCGRDVSASMA